MRIVGGLLRCSCGFVLRAKELRSWVAAKYPKVQAADNNHIFFVYEERNKDG
jgi:hypothetical protein